MRRALVVGVVAGLSVGCTPAVRLAAPDDRALSVALKSGATAAMRMSPTAFERREDRFRPQCLPYVEDFERTEISGACGEAGSEDSPPDLAAEFLQKNNLCAGDDPIDVSFAALRRMDQIVRNQVRDAEGNKPWRTEDRSLLIDFAQLPDGQLIGEGSPARIRGFVHKLTVNRGENVNCNITKEANNDFHIVVTAARPDAECQAIVAEAIPHYRPLSWTKANLLQLIGGPPVRISGALFFDGRHGDGSCTGGADPRRASNWEIHPVYRIDVCIERALSRCVVDDDDVWISFGEWLESG